VAALVAVPVAASASPPDPMWIEGIYDAADGDDVVMIVTWSSVAACSRSVPTTFGSETAASWHGPAYDLVSPLRSLEEIASRSAGRYDSARSSQSMRGPPQPLATRREENPCHVPPPLPSSVTPSVPAGHGPARFFTASL